MGHARLPRVPRWCKSYPDSKDARGLGPHGSNVNDTSDQNPKGPADPPATDTSEDEASALWLVSFSDDDDRELRPPQIAEALRLGEINAETIVWRQGADDWLPLAQVPALAKLLSASGETATAPLVAPNPALLRRAAAKPPAPPEPGAVKTPSVRPMIAGRAVPTAKGTTKLGIPKFDPTKGKPEATPLPAQQAAAAPPAAKAAVPDMTPTIPKSPAVPMTPTKSRAETLPKANIFASASDDEEAPISIEPEFMRPPSPAPARAMQRAKALSPGTLGMKKPAPPPRPPMKSTPDAEPPRQEPPKQEPPKQEPPKQEATAPAAPLRGKKAPPSPPRKAQPSAPAIIVAPDPALTPDPGTPSLGTLAAPVRAETKAAEPKRVDEGILNAEELLARAVALDPAATGAESPAAAATETPKPETPTAPIVKDVERETSSSTPSKSDALAKPLAARSAESTDAPVSQARPSAPAKPASKSSWPLLAGVGAVALIAVLFARGNRDKVTEPANPEAPTVATAQPAEPATAAPAEPAAPAAVATEAPTPAMTAEVAPAPAAPQNDTPSAAPKEKPAAPAMAAAKAETVAAPKETTPAAPQPEKPAKVETKPAETKPAAAAEPKEVAVGGDFDKAAAGTALTSAAQEASGCRKEGDPSGVAVVHVTFSNAGRATRAVIEGPPFAGTQTGGCIAATLRKATVPPYGGDRVTVTKKVVIR